MCQPRRHTVLPKSKRRHARNRNGRTSYIFGISPSSSTLITRLDPHAAPHPYGVWTSVQQEPTMKRVIVFGRILPPDKVSNIPSTVIVDTNGSNDEEPHASNSSPRSPYASPFLPVYISQLQEGAPILSQTRQPSPQQLVPPPQLQWHPDALLHQHGKQSGIMSRSLAGGIPKLSLSPAR